MKGHIELVIGPMFSGKSTELQRRLRRYALAHKTCFLVQYSKDTRYDTATADPETGAPRAALVTHDRRVVPAHCAVERLRDAAAAVPPGTHVIAVDEAQFFPDAVEVCQAWADAGVTVLVAALDATYERLPFDVTTRLVAVAEDVVKLVSVCADCGDDRALWSFRTTTATALEVIGGADAYKPLCRQCWQRQAPQALSASASASASPSTSTSAP